MRTLLLGLVVGALCGFALERFVFSPGEKGHRLARGQETPRAVPARATDTAPTVDTSALEARIAELEALLARANRAAPIALPEGLAVPETDEEIELLLEEFQKTDDLDALLALFHALLLQGERGYPKLTQLLLRVVGKGMAGRFNEEQMVERIVPAIRLALRHERELVGYVGYLLEDTSVPPMLRTGATAIAMFLAINHVPGSDAFAPRLLESFLRDADPGGLGPDQMRMLVTAMGMLRQKEAVDPLLGYLRDPSMQRYHHSAIEALGRIGDERAIGPLVQRLRTQGGENQWWSQEVMALARIGTPDAIAAAELYLSGIAEPGRLLNQAASFLQVRPSPKVIELVATTFRANPGADNLWSVMRGLNQAGTPEALAVLEEMATSATQDYVRRQARSMLDDRKKVQQEITEGVR